ncbi:MAG TPA: hypothetical protein VL346_02770 [Acidobacteriaceae bacterium]|nr:hypothetical protein [Acidobacteriaceae bacterium]
MAASRMATSHMAADAAVRHYRAVYAMLLRLYPRAFRERFSEGMAQTFHDLCRERQNASQPLFGFALWIYLETSEGIVMENLSNMRQLGNTMLRVALGALAMLMAPLVASRLVEGWHWSAASFVFVYVLFFAVGMVYALIARRMNVWSYKAGVGLALASGFALGWSTMVQTADSGHPERLWYLSVLVVGLIGASIARLRAPGLAVTLFAMAAVLALISVALPSGAPPHLALRMAIGHAAFVALFTTAGLLFRHASQARSS